MKTKIQHIIWNAAKAVPRGLFINTYIKKKKRAPINNQILNLHEPGGGGRIN